MKQKSSICLVSCSHLSSNPRLVKEADALIAEGYKVRVVCGSNHGPNRILDKDILDKSTWSYEVVEYGTGPVSWMGRILRKCSRFLLSFISTELIAAQAHHPAAWQLARAAGREKADFYIGHTLAGLAAAGMAASRHDSLLGFDAEDFHSLETSFALEDPAEKKAVYLLEQHFLTRCVHLTAASPMIGLAYSEKYGTRAPDTVLNVFPLDWAPEKKTDPVSSSEFNMYWFSQTIGPGRGLEHLVDVACRMEPGVRLFLRGDPAPGYLENLTARAASQGHASLIQHLAPAASSQMARLASEADLGLSLEEPFPPNRDLCLTNKVFTYLLAGIPQLMSPTRAQKEIALQFGEAALLADITDTEDAGRRLELFRNDLSARRRAADTARRLARERYCWDLEKNIFLQSIRRVLEQ